MSVTRRFKAERRVVEVADGYDVHLSDEQALLIAVILGGISGDRGGSVRLHLDPLWDELMAAGVPGCSRVEYKSAKQRLQRHYNHVFGGGSTLAATQQHTCSRADCKRVQP